MPDETVKEIETPLTLKEQLQQRHDQLELQRKQTEMQYVEIMGALQEIKRTIALIP